MAGRIKRLLVLIGAAMLVLVPLLTANVPVKVTGLGWLHDREMRITLERLLNSHGKRSFDSNAIEDAAVILNSALVEDGFQTPTIEIAVTLADGSVRRFQFDATFDHPIPRPLDAKSVTFRIRPGVRWRLAHVVIDGLTVLSAKAAESYFRSSGTLFIVSRANVYSKSQLSRSADALLDELKRRGYAEATVRAEVESVVRKTGAVTVRVTVHEGALWKVARVEIRGPSVQGVANPDVMAWRGTPWSPRLEDDIREAVRVAYYKGGYPDVALQVEANAGVAANGQRPTVVVVSVRAGARVTMGQPRFVGNKKTRTWVLRRRVSLQPGQPLNPIELEHARYRISRLGVFESVDLGYDPPHGPVRDPIFALKEGPTYETNLLFGYGSYEQLRGGVEYRQMNILGLAHQSRLLLVQSMKSTSGEYTYTVPELFGENIDGTAKLFGLQRQEVAFVRQEYGATVSLRRALPGIRGDATVGYTFQALRNRNNGLSTEATDEKQVNAASLDLGLTTDRLDNALRPRQGYHASAQLELASPNLGGTAAYQRLQLAGAYHTAWGDGRWIHIGLAHGVVTTYGARNDVNLPVNERFYPGGDNSIRGYRAGQAAPRGADGRFIGAKSYVGLNVELEQALTSSWSAVVFSDALGTAASLRDYPFRERLYSVGVGLRYQTIIGPVRIEYGQNVNPRPGDPRGTLLLSIGYPF